MAEFAAVAGLLALLFAAVVQLAVVQHVRATAADCAGEGARFGALRGNTPELGARRSRELLTASLSPRFADHVAADVVDLGGLRVVQVDVDAPLPVIGLFGVGRGMHLEGHAVLEGAR